MSIVALVRASHPYPIAMVVSLTALIGIASSEGGPDWTAVAVATLAMLLSQLGIGWSNDYLDRGRDALYQPEKPVPSGAVSAGLLALLTPVTLAASAGAGAVLGPLPLVLLVAGTSCGMAYNLALKDTHLSWLPYVVAFAILPAYVWASLDVFRWELAWLYPLGASLAVAAHIANTLPDIEGDAAAGAGGLAVRLGRRRALLALGFCLALPLPLLLLTSLWVEYSLGVLAAVLAGYALLTVAAFALYRQRPFRPAAKRAFRLIAPAAVLLATGWLAAV